VDQIGLLVPFLNKIVHLVSQSRGSDRVRSTGLCQFKEYAPVVGRIGLGVQVSASFQKNALLVGQLGSEDTSWVR